MTLLEKDNARVGLDLDFIVDKLQLYLVQKNCQSSDEGQFS